MIIEEKESLDEIKSFLESNCLYKIGTTTKDGISYFEADSIEGNKLLVNKSILNNETFIKIMNRFVESRNMLLEQKYNNIYTYNLDTMQGGACIEFYGSKCNVILYTSTTDENILAPSDREFLNKLLDLADNGSEPNMYAKNNDDFYLTLGRLLTINFDRKLLKYVEEYIVNCKSNQEYIMKLERKNKNEK